MWLLAAELFTPLDFSVIFYIQLGSSPARKTAKRNVTKNSGIHIIQSCKRAVKREPGPIWQTLVPLGTTMAVEGKGTQHCPSTKKMIVLFPL